MEAGVLPWQMDRFTPQELDDLRAAVDQRGEEVTTLWQES